MVDHVRPFIGLYWRYILITLPFLVEPAKASTRNTLDLDNESIRSIATHYSDLLLIIFCLICLVAGALTGFFYPIPKYGAKPYPKFLKVVISIICGSLAFLYYIDGHKVLSPGICVWVAGVSFVSPATLYLIHAAAIKFLGLKLGVDQDELDRINKSFKDEE